MGSENEAAQSDSRLGRVKRDRHKSPSELALSIVPRRTSVNKRRSATPARKRSSDWIVKDNIIFAGVPAGAEQDPV